MANRVRVVVDNRLRVARADLVPEVEAAIVAAFTHKNPKAAKNRAMGFSTWKVEPMICTARMTAKQLTLPRGGTQQVREVLAAHGLAPTWDDRRLELEPVEMPELKLKLRGYQEGAVAAMVKRENCILRAPTGCMDGATVVGINRAGKSFRIRLDELVRKHNGGTSIAGRSRAALAWDPSIVTTVRSRAEDGTIRLARLLDAYENGTKLVYEVRTRSGHRVVATADHRLLTQDGWKRLSEISMGDRLFVEDPRRKTRKTHQKRTRWYRLVSGLVWHPHVGRRGVKPSKGGWSVPLHRLVAEARENGVALEDYLDAVRGGRIAGLRFIDPKTHDVHHADENPQNNDPSNLEVLSKRDHQRRHVSPEHVLPRTMTSEVVSIRSIGERPTYDLSLEEPHNFLANGVVVHNSGKTCAAFALIARLRQPALVILWSANLLKQWRDRLKTDFGMQDRDIGIIRGSRRTVAPITLAMQQSLWARGIPEEVSGNFGLVLIDEAQRVAAATVRTVIDAFPARYRFAITADECVAVGTPIEMADGSSHPIEQVRENAYVRTPLGPRRVIHCWQRQISEIVLLRWNGGSLRCVVGTPVAGSQGWVAAESATDLYLSDGELHRVREADEETLQDRTSREVQDTYLRPVREMRELRGSHSVEGERSPHAHAQRQQSDFVGEGLHEGDAPESGRNLSEDDRRSSPVRSGPDRERTGSSGLAEEGCGGVATQVRLGLETSTLARARERVTSTPVREESCQRSVRSWVSIEGQCRSREGETEPLRAGPRERGEEGCGGDRRTGPLTTGSPGAGWSKGQPPLGARMARDQVPVVVRSGRPTTAGCRLARVEVIADGLFSPSWDLEVDGSCYFAGGALVHNTRKDRMDFLTREMFGPVAADIKRRDLVRDGTIHDVAVRVVPTTFEAPWYGDSSADAKDAFDFNRLLDEMTHDDRRNGLVLGIVACEVAAGRQVLVFTHRVEHARMLSDAVTVQLGQPCGLLIGGPYNAVRFEEDRAAILSGRMRVAVGTVQAIGQGLDLPSVAVGVVATPIASNKQLFDQVRGRICRTAAGKEDAELVYLLDWRVYPGHLGNVEGWCDDVVGEQGCDLDDLRRDCRALADARREARWGRRGEQPVPGFDDGD